MRALRPHPVLAGIALAAMLMSSSAAAFALQCAFGCPDTAVAAPAKDAHACCPGSERQDEPDPQVAIRAAMPDCCAYVDAADRTPRLQRDDVELTHSSPETVAAPVTVVRLPAPTLREFGQRGPLPSAPPGPPATNTTVLLL